jgi:isopenicillin-N epimerase
MPSPLASHWGLDPAITYLNHGSFGACPTAVLTVQSDWRRRMESEPVRFLDRELDDNLAEARGVLGGFVGADPDDLALIANSTGGVNAVVRSLQFKPGDEILTTDHEYNAVLNVIRYVAARDGARVVVARLPFPPESADGVLERILGEATDRTVLTVVSHVTSPTAIVLPVERLVPALAARGIDTLVDGAHAPGMIPLDLERLGAAYYVGDLHKWVCAPKGAAFLHVRRDRQAGVRPATISHGANVPVTDRPRDRSEFDWQGTLDPSAWLSVPAALRYIAGLVDGGWPAVMARTYELTLQTKRDLETVLGTGASPDEMLGSMVALPLPIDEPLGGGAPREREPSPLDVEPLQTLLFDRFRIEVPVYAWPVPAALSPDPRRRLIRVSMGLHNAPDDLARLVAALTQVSGS